MANAKPKLATIVICWIYCIIYLFLLGIMEFCRMMVCSKSNSISGCPNSTPTVPDTNDDILLVHEDSDSVASEHVDVADGNENQCQPVSITPCLSPCNGSTADSGVDVDNAGTTPTSPNNCDLNTAFPELCLELDDEWESVDEDEEESLVVSEETVVPEVDEVDQENLDLTTVVPTPEAIPQPLPDPGKSPGFCINTNIIERPKRVSRPRPVLEPYEGELQSTNIIFNAKPTKSKSKTRVRKSLNPRRQAHVDKPPASPACRLEWGSDLLNVKPEIDSLGPATAPIEALEGQQLPNVLNEIIQCTFAQMKRQEDIFWERLELLELKPRIKDNKKNLFLSTLFAPPKSEFLKQLSQFDRKSEIIVIDEDGNQTTFTPTANESSDRKFEYNPNSVAAICRIFYHGDRNSNRHFISGSTLRRWGWRQNHRDKLWYHRLAEPKFSNDCYEIGTYDRFNPDSWSFQRMENFRFEYS